MKKSKIMMLQFNLIKDVGFEETAASIFKTQKEDLLKKRQKRYK